MRKENFVMEKSARRNFPVLRLPGGLVREEFFPRKEFSGEEGITLRVTFFYGVNFLGELSGRNLSRGEFSGGVVSLTI